VKLKGEEGMNDLKAALASLQPPLTHTVEFRNRIMHVTLTDPSISASVSRAIEPWQYQSHDLFQIIILHAIHELQGMGSHAPLQKLPLVGGRLMQADDFRTTE
jgi:hypothetical protein